MQMNHAAWILILNALAVFRLTRLITTDTIAQPLRESQLQVGRFAVNPGVFLTCDWCVSIWFGAAVVALSVEWRYWPYVAGALSYSAVTGIIASRT